MSLPYRWYPSGTVHRDGGPVVGDLVPFEHQVWRVVEIRPLPETEWTDADRDGLDCYTPGVRWKYMPRVMRLRPIREDTANLDKHFILGGRARHSTYYWAPYPDEHYPVCAKCLEPLPCREQMAATISEAAADRMTRYETEGVCPACREVVSTRQKSWTWPDNAMIPGGPPVTFHQRRQCRSSAVTYEKVWVASDPDRRRAILSCPGHVVNHNDGTYSCSQLTECPGPRAVHPSYTVCACPDCHARGPFGCTPPANARNTALDEP